MNRLLDDLMVLDLTRFLSGPHCTLLLAGMGAQVIKVDDPASGDPTVAAPPFADTGPVSLQRNDDDALGIAYLKRARGKRSITVNLKDAKGRELFLRLAQHADVVVENFRPGVAARLGIDHATLRKHNPRLVYCAITGYGPSGPDHDLKSYDLMAQAASGLMGLSGEPDGPPMKTGSAFSDMVAGTYAALGILGAIHERTRSGLGQTIDVSMVDCLFTMMMDEPLDWYERLGLAPRLGNRIMRFSPFNAYQARDGWVTLGVVSATEWHALLEAIGREEIKHDADFSEPQWRIANNQAVDALIEPWIARHTVSEIVSLLRAADVPCAPVRTPQEALSWPHLRQRGMLRPLLQPDGSATQAVAGELPLKFDRSLAAHDRPAPPPGAHTNEVLQHYLGLSDDALAALRADGII